MKLTYDNKYDQYSNPAKNAKLVAKVKPADHYLWNWSCRHYDDKYHGAKPFYSQGNEYLAEGRSKGFVRNKITID